MIRRVQTDPEGRALAMELIIGALMANYCRDPEHPTYDEISAVAAELKAMQADVLRPKNKIIGRNNRTAIV